jgi:hypothetical protein
LPTCRVADWQSAAREIVNNAGIFRATQIGNLRNSTLAVCATAAHRVKLRLAGFAGDV